MPLFPPVRKTDLVICEGSAKETRGAKGTLATNDRRPTVGPGRRRVAVAVAGTERSDHHLQRALPGIGAQAHKGLDHVLLRCVAGNGVRK